MSIKQTCKTCQFYDNNGGQPLCRVNPPQSVIVPGGPPSRIAHPGKQQQVGISFLSWWPNVSPDRDWCGKHLPAPPYALRAAQAEADKDKLGDALFAARVDV